MQKKKKTPSSNVNFQNHSDLAVIILAAGIGKRMKSSLPKVLHSVCGEPMLHHLFDRLRELQIHKNLKVHVGLVVGHGREQVENSIRLYVKKYLINVEFIHQAEQLGTGHAARCAMDSAWGARIVKAGWPVLVMPGDTPLISTEMLESLTMPLSKTTPIRVLTTQMENPTGYGRIIRSSSKQAAKVQKIVEEKDANQAQRNIKEVAVSTYLFQSDFLVKGLQKLSNGNAQREYYLTDLVEQAKGKSEAYCWSKSEDLRGVNDLWELSQVHAILNRRTVEKWARAGVKFLNPESVQIGVNVEIGVGSLVYPGAILEGETKIAENVTLGSNVFLRDMKIGAGSNIKTGCYCENSLVGESVQLGPYAHLRPESQVSDRVKIGNFVELKKSRIGKDSSVAHLSYLGDAEVGERVNIGCGFITCNFDGRVIEGQRKHRTLIEDDVFMGSDCQTVAPVKIGRGSYVASGSTITDNVEPESLAIARARQVTKIGYVKKLKQS